MDHLGLRTGPYLPLRSLVWFGHIRCGVGWRVYVQYLLSIGICAQALESSGPKRKSIPARVRHSGRRAFHILTLSYLIVETANNQRAYSW